jgi:carboxylesterase type B
VKRRRSLLFDTRFGPSAFRPVVDGALLKELPMQAMAAGRTISVPVLIGTNLDELRILSALYDTPVELRFGVNFTHFLQKWPKNQHLSSKCLHQSLEFHEFTFSPPGVSVYESDGGSHLPAFE